MPVNNKAVKSPWAKHSRPRDSWEGDTRCLYPPRTRAGFFSATQFPTNGLLGNSAYVPPHPYTVPGRRKLLCLQEEPDVLGSKRQLSRFSVMDVGQRPFCVRARCESNRLRLFGALALFYL